MSKRIKELLSQPDRTFNAQELSALAAYFRTVMFDTLHDRGTGHWGGARIQCRADHRSLLRPAFQSIQPIHIGRTVTESSFPKVMRQ